MQGLRSDSMERLIEQELIYFPPCKSSDVQQFATRTELLAAIAAGKGPMLPKKKTPLLRADLPDLDFWIGRPIAAGRPSRKEHWTARPEEDRLAPLSSWIGGVNEDVVSFSDDEDAEPVVLRSTRGGVATEEVKAILGSKAFSYPKPLSLIKNLLAQSTQPGDTVLDFFAGSGTTGQAVMELNAEDGGQRRVILCSSTEATTKEPQKNLCRDVCAERMRRVMQGYGGKPALGGSFAYLQLDSFDAADLPFEAGFDHAALLLGLREQRAIPACGNASVQQVAGDAQLAVLLCSEVSESTIDIMASWPAERLVVYSSRPDTVRQLLLQRGKDINSYSLIDALLRGQTTLRAN